MAAKIRHCKKQTVHGVKRLRSRVGIKNKKIALRVIIEASKSGKDISFFAPGELYNYLKSKDRGKRIRVYNGVVYIFNKTSDRLITAYPIPEELMEEYRNYGK